MDRSNGNGWHAGPDTDEAAVAIIGGGLGGICAALYLEKAGIGPLVIFEKSHEPGGVWSANTYPGCACDIPAHLYSYSMETDMDWSRGYPQQHELLAYVKKIVSKHKWDEKGVLRLGSFVEEARWNEDSLRWEVRVQPSAPGSAPMVVRAKYLVVATGALIDPTLPKVEGLGSFKGVSMHTARYDNSVDLKGKRVAVVGTGASAIQVIPSVAPEVGHLTVFMRTPPWILPKIDGPFSERALQLLRWTLPRLLLRNFIYRFLETLGVPMTHRRTRWAQKQEEVVTDLVIKWRGMQVKDPELLKALTPNYSMGCKRVLLSDEFYPAMCRENVSLVASGVTRVTETGLVDAQGREHPVDVIIWATGFDLPAMWTQTKVFGRGGRSWIDLMGGRLKSAYLGLSTPGLPNFLQVQGTNQGLGHNSVVLMMEAECRYFTELVTRAEALGASTVEVEEEVNRAFAQEMRDRLATSVWRSGGCRSWYLNVDGEETDLLWPGSVDEYIARTRHVDLSQWVLRDQVGKRIDTKSSRLWPVTVGLVAVVLGSVAFAWPHLAPMASSLLVGTASQ